MIWQTQKWQDMLKKSGQVEKTIVVDKNIFIEKRKISLGETALFVLGLDPKDFSPEIESKLIAICKQEQSLFLQIETFSYEENITINSQNFKNTHFKNFITPFTAVIDLEQSEDDILKHMKPKGRYNIKVAKKKGVVVQTVEQTEKNIKTFVDLLSETAQRDNFMTNADVQYYTDFLATLDASELIFAYKDEQVIAAGIFTYESGVAIYYYGASSSQKQYRNLMAPYLVQWEAIALGKEKGCTMYDFLGVADPENKHDELAGVTSFKLKFTKDVREVSKNYVFVNKKLKYFMMNALRKIQKKLKKT